MDWKLEPKTADLAYTEGSDTLKSKSSNLAQELLVPGFLKDECTDNIPYWNYDDWKPWDTSENAEKWRTHINMAPEQEYLLDPSGKRVGMGFGWDKDVDIDSSVTLFDGHLKPVDRVWYKKLKSNCRSVTHSGDSMTGANHNSVYDEVISVKLAEIPHGVHYLLFAVSVYTVGVSFRDVRSVRVCMKYEEKRYNDYRMCSFSTTDMSGTAMLMGMLIRKGAYWVFRALGTPATGRSVLEIPLNPYNLSCLTESPAHTPEFRHVTVTIYKGTNLVATKCPCPFGRPTTSDPYYTIHFKDRKGRAEYKTNTVNPEWELQPFELGWITETDTSPLEIGVSSHNLIAFDDYMGAIVIPAHCLFRLGQGEHTYWFVMSDSQSSRDKHKPVSGELLMTIRVIDECSPADIQ